MTWIQVYRKARWWTFKIWKYYSHPCASGHDAVQRTHKWGHLVSNVKRSSISHSHSKQFLFILRVLSEHIIGFLHTLSLWNLVATLFYIQIWIFIINSCSVNTQQVWYHRKWVCLASILTFPAVLRPLNVLQTAASLSKFLRRTVWPPSQHQTKQNVWVFYNLSLFCFPASGSHSNARIHLGQVPLCLRSLPPAVCLHASGQGIQRITSQHVYNHPGCWPVAAAIRPVCHPLELRSLCRINRD